MFKFVGEYSLKGVKELNILEGLLLSFYKTKKKRISISIMLYSIYFGLSFIKETTTTLPNNGARFTPH